MTSSPGYKKGSSVFPACHRCPCGLGAWKIILSLLISLYLAKSGSSDLPKQANKTVLVEVNASAFAYFGASPPRFLFRTASLRSMMSDMHLGSESARARQQGAEFRPIVRLRLLGRPGLYIHAFCRAYLISIMGIFHVLVNLESSRLFGLCFYS